MIKLVMENNLPQIRMILGPPRSGTTVLQNALCEAENTQGIYEPIRVETFEDKKPLQYLNFSVFKSLDDPECHPEIKKQPKKTFILKEAMGYFLAKLGNRIIPSDKDVERAKPVFIFRDPYDTYNSIKKVGWYPINDFISIYKKCCNTCLELKKRFPDNITVVTYDQFMKNPGKILEKICKNWGLKFNDNLLNWKKSVFDKISFHPNQRERMLRDGIHNTLLNQTGKLSDCKPKKLKLNFLERRKIRRELEPLYKQVSEIANKDFPDIYANTGAA